MIVYISSHFGLIGSHDAVGSYASEASMSMGVTGNLPDVGHSPPFLASDDAPAISPARNFGSTVAGTPIAERCGAFNL